MEPHREANERIHQIGPRADNRFQSEESGSSHYPGEEHYYLGEKIKPQPPFYRRYGWQILVDVLIGLVLVIASFTAGVLSRSEVTVIPKAPTVASTQPQVEPTQLPTAVPTQAPTQPPVTYPKLAVQYTGISHNSTCVAGNSNNCYCRYANGQTDPNCDFTLTFGSIVQNQGEFSGFVSGNFMYGSDPFTGSLTGDGKVSITITNVGSTTTVAGVLHPDGSMSGTYTVYAETSPTVAGSSELLMKNKRSLTEKENCDSMGSGFGNLPSLAKNRQKPSKIHSMTSLS